MIDKESIYCTADKIYIMHKKKGQTIFEFIIACVILFSVILYTLTFVNSELEMFSGNFNSDMMNSKVVQVTESFLNPYSTYSIVDEWPVLDHNKMVVFNNNCNNDVEYVAMLNNMELYTQDPLGGKNNMHLKIIAKDLDTDTEIINCGRLPLDLVERPMVFESKRLGVDSDTNNPIELKVWIW